MFLVPKKFKSVIIIPFIFILFNTDRSTMINKSFVIHYVLHSLGKFYSEHTETINNGHFL